MNIKKTSGLLLLGFAAGGVAVSYLWMRRGMVPTPSGSTFYFRLNHPESLGLALYELEGRHVIRNSPSLRIYAWFKRLPSTVRAGTYSVRPGMTGDQVLEALGASIHEKFRFPETNWARRNANLLQKADIATASDYLSLVNDPPEFQRQVSFPLPATTLEGYLYPDTYDLAPLTGAQTVIDRQLRAFENKVVKRLGPVAASDTVIRKASLVELETGTDRDRAMIAGVIENRLSKGMPLQIDAGIEYALGKWRRLYFKDYKDVKSPYNLYLYKGLPPTPICSPSLKSIEAVLHPVKHHYLYYVAMPDGHSIYAKTPAEHEHNIRLRKLALAARAKQRNQMLQFFTPGTHLADPHSGRA